MKTKTTLKQNLSQTDTCLLWGRAAGRCEFEGCNKILHRDKYSFKKLNTGDRAHIIARSKKGPRGDIILSEKEVDNIDNLMLLCKDCHKRIDTYPSDYPIAKLKKMKRLHEQRVEYMTDFHENMESYLVTYAANIGDIRVPINNNDAFLSMLKNGKNPAQAQSIDLSNSGNALKDYEPEFWKVEEQNLIKKFNQKLLDRISETEDVKHISLFAMAPVPLLIKLGTLFTDKIPMDIYQKRREPDTWNWNYGKATIEFEIEKTSSKSSIIALNLSISANISNDDIKKTLGKDVSIWSIRLKNPNYDCIKTPNDLSEFRKVIRTIYDEIKSAHGSDKIINIFAAVPVSVAIEIGRTWMPRADLPIQTYNRTKGSLQFNPAILIGKENQK